MKGFDVQSLDRSHDRKSFSCGIDSLDKYLRQHAGQDKRNKVSVTYVLLDKTKQKIAGYYTLSSAAVELMALPDEIKKKLPNYPALPATLIGRLAIDVNYQKMGFGEILLLNALKRSYDTSLHVASLAVIVEAINKSAEDFYKKYGFLDLTSNDKRLFMPMDTIAKISSLWH